MLKVLHPKIFVFLFFCLTLGIFSISCNPVVPESSPKESAYQSSDLSKPPKAEPGKLVPFFIFHQRDTVIIDYEKGLYATKEDIYSLNEKYTVDYGQPQVRDVVTGKLLLQIKFPNCDFPTDNYLVGDYLVNRCGFRDDAPDSEKIQAWNLSDNSYIGEIPLNYNGLYVYFAEAPDSNHFLLSGPFAYTRLFRFDPFQELPMQAKGSLTKDLFPSPDKKFVISENRALWRWTGNDVELIESVPELSPSHEILSVSTDADYVVYLYHYVDNKMIPSTLIVKDRKTNIEVLSLSQDDPIFSGLEIRDSAISHDGSLLLVSTIKNLSVGTVGKFEYYLFVIQTKSGEVLHQFGPLSGPVPQRLSVEYLPEAIRETWVWEKYNNNQN